MVCSSEYTSTTKIVQLRPSLDLDLSMARSNRLSGVFIWENARTYDSVDIVEDFGLKFDRCSHVKETIRYRPPGFAGTKICSSGS